MTNPSKFWPASWEMLGLGDLRGQDDPNLDLKMEPSWNPNLTKVDAKIDLIFDAFRDRTSVDF